MNTINNVQPQAPQQSLTTQAYTITPMLDDMQIGASEEVSFDELMVKVNQYNVGDLNHCDAWFEIHNLANKEYPMETFYQFIDGGECSTPANEYFEAIASESYDCPF